MNPYTSKRAAPCLAQEFRALILGSVTDPAGASVPGARVTAINTATGGRVTT
jgi:hypothetical protein